MSARPAPAAGLVDGTVEAIALASEAVMMGTAIVSIALSLDGQEPISRVVLVLAAVFWVALGVLLPARSIRDRKRCGPMSVVPRR